MKWKKAWLWIVFFLGVGESDVYEFGLDSSSFVERGVPVERGVDQMKNKSKVRRAVEGIGLLQRPESQLTCWRCRLPFPSHECGLAQLGSPFSEWKIEQKVRIQFPACFPVLIQTHLETLVVPRLLSCTSPEDASTLSDDTRELNDFAIQITDALVAILTSSFDCRSWSTLWDRVEPIHVIHSLRGEVRGELARSD